VPVVWPKLLPGYLAVCGAFNFRAMLNRNWAMACSPLANKPRRNAKLFRKPG
jgi:hypothetical protein